jgi:hypothetical protein
LQTSEPPTYEAIYEKNKFVGVSAAAGAARAAGFKVEQALEPILKGKKCQFLNSLCTSSTDLNRPPFAAFREAVPVTTTKITYYSASLI